MKPVRLLSEARASVVVMRRVLGLGALARWQVGLVTREGDSKKIRGAFRRGLSIPGYDARPSGVRVAEVHTA